MKSNCFAQTASLIIVSFVTRLDLATSDEYDDRVEFCKRHLSPTVAEDARYRQLQRQHRVKRDVDEEERYSTLDDCFRAKFFNPDRQDEGVVLETVQTNGPNFAEKLNNISWNVSKLIVDVSYDLGKTPRPGELDILHLNLSSMAQFVHLEELWLRNIPNPRINNVVELHYDASLGRHLPLKRFHVDLPIHMDHLYLNSFQKLTLLSLMTLSGHKLIEAQLHDSLHNLKSLRVLSALQFSDNWYTMKFSDVEFANFTSAILYLELGQNSQNIDYTWATQMPNCSFYIFSLTL